MSSGMITATDLERRVDGTCRRRAAGWEAEMAKKSKKSKSGKSKKSSKKK
jgi:hypothetical protein